MDKNDPRYGSFVQILREELVPAMGCTEPIALAYGAAKARDVLGCLPDKVKVEASGNIIKNVKSVVVPNTDGLKGIEALYSRNRGTDEAFVRKLADEYDLFITGGSDFHGTNKPDIELGRGEGKLRVPVMLLENLK